MDLGSLANHSTMDGIALVDLPFAAVCLPLSSHQKESMAIRLNQALFCASLVPGLSLSFFTFSFFSLPVVRHLALRLLQ